MAQSTELTVDALADLIGRSGLVAREQVQPLLRKLAEQGIPADDGSAIVHALVQQGTLTAWQAKKLLEGCYRGFFLGPYRLLRLLGKGGMGSVFLAEHETMRRRCAVKVLPTKRRHKSSSMLDRFYVEAQAVAALDHPNIVRAYDLNKEVQGSTEIHYLVMEYVDGQDFRRLVQDHGVLDCVRAAEFTRQAAHGLAHAHERGLIHRDVKPSNLMVNTKEVVKVLDLGFAQFYEKEQASLSAVHRDRVLGTADYLSPEQALDSHRIDTRADIYSLGCTIYFMLTGRPPFPKGTVAQRLLAHQTKTPAPISKRRRDVPPDLIAIIDRMMAKKPEDRFRSATEVADTLTAWLIHHAPEEWKQQRPELVRESFEMAAGACAERNVALTDSVDETELELRPLDEEPSATGDDNALEQHDVAEDGAAEPAFPLDELPASAEDPPPGSPLGIDLLSEPLEQLESSGGSHVYLDTLTEHSHIHSGGLGSGSGANQWTIGAGHLQHRGPSVDDDSFRAVMRTIGVGLAAGVLLAVLVLSALLLWSGL